jgi:hypothetical protein
MANGALIQTNGDLQMVDLSIDVNDDGFIVSIVRVEDGITIPLLDGSVDSVTINKNVLDKADIIED